MTSENCPDVLVPTLPPTTSLRNSLADRPLDRVQYDGADNAEAGQVDTPGHCLEKLGAARSSLLLVVFAVSHFVDVCNLSGVGLATARLGHDTGLAPSQWIWVRPQPSRFPSDCPSP